MKISAKINAIGFEGAEVKPEEIAAALEKAAAEVGRIAVQKMAVRSRELVNLKVEVNRLIAKLNARLGDDKVTIAVDVVKNEAVTVRQPMSQVPSRSPRIPRVPRETGDVLPLGTMARQIAGILAAYHPDPVKRSILAALCGVVDGGNFSGRLSEVRSNGLLEEPGRGLLAASQKCVDEFLGVFDPPTNTAQVLELWDKKLGTLAQQILRKLVEANGEPIRRADLAADLGLVDGGNFSGRLSEVRSTGLMLEPGRGLVAANKEALFLNGAAA